MLKTNEYTGATYECKCDYTYTCAGCEAVRTAFASSKQRQARDEWIVDTLKRIAEKLEIDIGEPP